MKQNLVYDTCGFSEPAKTWVSLVLLFIFLCVLNFSPALSQNQNNKSSEHNASSESEIDPQRLALVGAGHLVAFSGTLLMLDQLWYKEYPRSAFHFHDDLGHWKQMDKAGHAVTAYHISRLSYSTYRWAGMENRHAALWGSISGSVLLTTIEILDGFSKEWGASWSDLGANTLGALSFYAQQRAWEQQKITWKYSFSSSGLRKYRPDLLGSTWGESLIKDYNGQTYWLSFNLESLFHTPSFIPTWLNVAAGYGAMGMLGSERNPTMHQGMILPDKKRYRQFYLSPDIDFARIAVRSKILRYFLHALNFIKFPAPTLEYSSHKGLQFHWVFF